MPCRGRSSAAAAGPLALVVVLLTAGLSQSALADANNSSDDQGDINITSSDERLGSLRGECKSKNAICGSHGTRTARCCRGLKCQAWLGSFEMRCVDRRPSPTPAPTPAPTPPPAPRFEIRWAGQSNTCMDVPGGRDKNFNQMQVFACDYPQNQQFFFDQAPGRGPNYGQFRWAKHPNKCLDVKHGNTANFAEVVLYSCHPSNHRHFDHQVFHVDSFSGWTFIRWHNKCVDLKDGIVGSFDSSRRRKNQPKSEVITYDCHLRDNKDWIDQQWYMEYRV